MGISMIDIMLYPVLISIPLAVLVGPVGSILVWRRSSFLSDVIAHMGVLAFALSELFQLPVLTVALVVSIIIALLLEWGPSFIPKDAWLSGISSFGIAIGVILLSVATPGHSFDHVFWGDVFALTQVDVVIFSIAAAFVGVHLKVLWNSIMLIIFHEQLAMLDGLPVKLIKVMISIITGGIIALCFKVMGVLLSGALFILPSVGIRFLHLPPEKHILLTVALIVASFVLGMLISVGLDVIVGPWIIISLIILNFAVFFIKKGIDSWREK